MVFLVCFESWAYTLASFVYWFKTPDRNFIFLSHRRLPMRSEPLFSGDWIQCHKDSKHIFHVTFDAKNSSVNKFNQKTLNELGQVVELIKKDETKNRLFSSHVVFSYFLSSGCKNWQSLTSNSDST